MTLETFFEKFDTFADAPNAVARMRELVLDLAVQGKLAEQESADGSADDLVATASSVRAKLIAEKHLRKPRAIQPVAEFELSNIPSSWTWTSLAEITEIGPRNDVPDSATATFLPMPAIPQQYMGKLAGETRSWSVIKKGFTHLADGDIVLAKITPCFQNGKSAVIEGLENGIGAGTTELHVARPFAPIVEPYYVWIFLRSPRFLLEGIPHMTGSAGQKRVPTGYFACKPFPLPPIAEQKRIVAKVDELMALCDRMEAQQKERDSRAIALARASLSRFADAPTPANLNLLFHNSYHIPPADLRKSILTLAVQGKLVPRIGSEGTGGEILRNAQVPEMTVENAPCLPDHWLWTTLGTVATMMNSGWSPACHPEPAKIHSWGVLKTTAVQPLLYQENQNKTLPNKLKPRPENEVIDGDLLFTRAGPMNRVGIVCVARPTRAKLMLSDKIIRIHLIPGIDPDFSALSISAGYSSEFIEELKSGMAVSQVNISQPKLRSVPVPIPPLEEQRRIVAKVDQLMALVNELETKLADSHSAAKNLLQALVAELTAAGASSLEIPA